MLEENRSDTELWRLFRQGDHQAFSGIYRRYINSLYRYGGRINTDYGIVEDAIQDMFVDLWKSRANLTDPESIKYYLFRILRRKIARNLSERLTTNELMNDEIDTFLRIESFEHEQAAGEQASRQVRMLQAALSSAMRLDMNHTTGIDHLYLYAGQCVRNTIKVLHNTNVAAMAALGSQQYFSSK